MEETDSLKRELEDLTVSFAPDAEKRTIEWKESNLFFGAVSPEDNRHVYLNPKHAESLDIEIPEKKEIDLLINTTSHEVEHTILTQLDSVSEFKQEHPDFQKASFVIMNTIEDVYIDKRRTNRLRGLRSVQAYFAKKYVESSDPVTEMARPEMFVYAFRHIALVGYAKGLKESNNTELKEFSARVKPLIEKAKTTHSNTERHEIGHEVMEILKEYVDDDINNDEYEKPPQGDGNEDAIPDDSEEGEEGDPSEDGDAGDDGEESKEGDESDGDTDENGDNRGEDNRDSEEDADGDNTEEGDDGEINEIDEDGDGDDSLDDLSDEELEDLIDELEELEDDDNANDWNNLPEETDLDEPSPFAEQIKKEIEEEEQQEETEIGRETKERDERIDSDTANISTDEVQEEYDDRLEKDVAEAFREIKTRDRPKPSTSGKEIGVRNYIRNRAGDNTEDRLFLEQKPAEAGDRSITVCVDASGSMSEMKTKIALLGISNACDIIGDRFAAVEFHQNQTNLITGPTENFNTKHLNSFNSGGGTPTASGIQFARSVSDMTPNSENVIIVITDGIANIGLNGQRKGGTNNVPIAQAASQVEKARLEGKRVIGLGVGDDISEGYLEALFGDNYVTTDEEDLADTLLEIYKGQMRTV